MSIYIRSFCLIALALLSYSFLSDDGKSGKELFGKHCVKCHGEDGTREKHKAKNLKLSKIGDAAIAEIIKEGKKPMPSYDKKLTEAEKRTVVRYTKTLRK